jgi:hypothetical protein
MEGQGKDLDNNLTSLNGRELTKQRIGILVVIYLGCKRGYVDFSRKIDFGSYGPHAK